MKINKIISLILWQMFFLTACGTSKTAGKNDIAVDISETCDFVEDSQNSENDYFEEIITEESDDFWTGEDDIAVAEEDVSEYFEDLHYSDGQIEEEKQDDAEPEEETIETIQDIPPDIKEVSISEKCFPELYKPGQAGPYYDQFAPVIAEHCFGTNHQDIKGVEQVVFFGDSVTVGTPNTAHLLSVDNSHFYRNKLAEWLAGHFDLDKSDLISWGLWKTYDYFNGTGGKIQSGVFWNCSKWGARTDDFLEGGEQIPKCFPEGGSSKRTLVVFTMGGNDIAKINQTGAEATPEEVAAGYPKAWELAKNTVKYLDDAVAWLKDEKKFPKGSFVIFTNGFEFTDATGKTDECSPQLKFNIPYIGEVDLSKFDIPVADIAGYGKWENQKIQEEIVIWILEQYMNIAVKYKADMIWTLEKFCGHGYVATGSDADTQNACYLGPDAELWFDETCVHPSETGHDALFNMFKAVVVE